MVIAVLMLTAVLSGLGLGLVTLTNTETAIAANYREASDVLHAADAAADCALADIRRASSFTSILSGTSAPSFRDASLTPTTPSGGRLDLAALTASLQAESDAATNLGTNNPRWSLFVNRSMATMVASPAATTYAVAWVADDPADGDNDPLRDSNGVVTVRAMAFGQFGTRKSIEVTITNARGTSALSWRELR
jgi:Tfp pilus assembly protein PilX